jgi:hypothetical protein
MLRHIAKRAFTTLVRAPEFPWYPHLMEYNAYYFNFELGKYVSKGDHIFTVGLPKMEYPVLSEHEGFVIHNYMSPRLCAEVRIGEPLFTLSDNPFTEEDNIDLMYASLLNKIKKGENLSKNDQHILNYITKTLKK